MNIDNIFKEGETVFIDFETHNTESLSMKNEQNRKKKVSKFFQKSTTSKNVDDNLMFSQYQAEFWSSSNSIQIERFHFNFNSKSVYSHFLKNKFLFAKSIFEQIVIVYSPSKANQNVRFFEVQISSFQNIIFFKNSTAIIFFYSSISFSQEPISYVKNTDFFQNIILLKNSTTIIFFHSFIFFFQESISYVKSADLSSNINFSEQFNTSATSRLLTHKRIERAKTINEALIQKLKKIIQKKNKNMLKLKKNENVDEQLKKWNILIDKYNKLISKSEKR